MIGLVVVEKHNCGTKEGEALNSVVLKDYQEMVGSVKMEMSQK